MHTDSPTPAWLGAVTTLAGIATSLWLSYSALSQPLPTLPARARPPLTTAADAGLGAPPSLAP